MRTGTRGSTKNISNGRKRREVLRLFRSGFPGLFAFLVAHIPQPDCLLLTKIRGAGRLALDPDTKLVPGWFIGDRSAVSAYHFISDLKDRLASRVQLTTDGHRPYLQAGEDAFGADVDYAMPIKIYGNAPEGPEVRYSPAQWMGARKTVISGAPDREHISTSQTERQNLTMRRSMRRFMRLTNRFSQKLENHEAAVALHYLDYNFGRIHKSLRVTPAMEAGIADHV